MQFTLLQLGAVLGFALTAKAHFVLQIPTSLGFDDAKEAEGPCGSYVASDRSTGVTDWPVGGSSIGVITTHLNVKWVIRAALISDITNFVSLVPVIDQTGFGSVCFTGILGKADWVGQDAVLQIWQDGVDGILYQCAAIKFVSGGPGAVPGDCTNSPGVTWEFETPLPDPVTSTPATSSPDVPTTPSTSTTSPVGPVSSASTSAAASSSGGSGSVSKTTTAGSSSGSSLGTASASKTTSKPTVASNATTTASSTKPATYTGSADKMRAGGAVVFLGGAALLGWFL